MSNEENVGLTPSGPARGATEPIQEGKRYDITAEEDPMAWAMEFIRIRQDVLDRTGEDIAKDPGTMVGWFSNAFARGEYNSPHYKAWLENHMREMFPQDDDPLDLVGTNTHDIGRTHAGGQFSKTIKSAEEYRRMIADKRARREPMAWLQYDEQGNQILVTNTDYTRLQDPTEPKRKK